MTISTEVRKAGPFIGNDSASVFPFAFKVFKAADLIVVRRQDNIGEETTLILDSDYHVTLNGNQDTTPGGVVTLVAGALASGFTLVVSSELPYLQPTDLTNQGGFYPKVITNALDRLTIFCQQLAEITGRTLKLPITAPTNISAEIPLPNPSELIAWNETGTGLTTVSPQSLVTSIAYGSATADLFAGDGATTTFPLSTNPASVNNLDVSIGGHSQRPVQGGVGDYSWNGGASITFVVPPPAPTVPGDKNVLVRYMQAIPVSDSEALHAQTREALRRSYAEAGFNLVDGSFETGGILTAVADVLLQESTGATYAWAGALPKVVAPGFDPVGVVGFELRTDVVLRDDLGISSSLTELQSSLSANKYVVMIDSIEVPTNGLSLPSYATVEAQNGAIGFIGDTYLANDALRKSGNASIALSNQDPNAGSVTVDAVVYQNPAWPSGSVYPQKSTMRNMGIVGNQAQHNEAGIFVLQGGVLSLDSVDVVNCVNGLWAKDLFLSDIRKLHTLGKIRIDNGTSVTFTDCWARGHTSRVGAFDFTGLKYSVLNGCASDGAPNTAYSFSNCQGLVLNGCGCEGAETITADAGTALDINDGNTLTINGFTCVPVESQGSALITVGDNSKVTIIGWDSNFDKNHAMDIYIHGSGSTVEIFSSKFYNNRDPVVSIAVGSTSVVILHKADGNTVKYYAPQTFGLAFKEAFFDKGIWTPVLNFAGGTTGITYSVQTGTWRKNGNQFIANGRITLTSKGSSSGVAFITGLPISSEGDESAKPNLALGVSGGPIVLALDKGVAEIFLLLDGASGMTNVSDTNLTNTTTLNFTMRLTVQGSVF